MKLELKGNENYCATIVEIKNIIPLEKCDNIVGTFIYGNHIIVGKDVKVGDKGIYFPVETAIKPVFLNANNLYRENSYNADPSKSSFFDLNGRVRCMSLRGFKSAGFFMPLNSLKAFGYKQDSEVLEVGTEFDHIDDEMICEKYFIQKKAGTPGSGISKADRRLNRISRLVPGQFHFHINTSFLAKNIHRIHPDSLISITEKVHGTSAIVSNILCNRELTWKDHIAKFFGVKIADKEYDLIWASRKVVKNKYAEKKNHQHFYSEDIWKICADELRPYIQEGMTIYYEIVGFTSDGAAIQGKAPHIFDYGCGPCEHKKVIYRITSTNSKGVVTEYSARQVQQFCYVNGLTAVPEHFYGRAKDLFPQEKFVRFGPNMESDLQKWQEDFLMFLEKNFLEKKCAICNNDNPNEGIVLRLESIDLNVFKFKSFAFKKLETKFLDEGLENIEDDQAE